MRHTIRRSLKLVLSLAALAAVPVHGEGSPGERPAAGTFDWAVGEWTGVRIDDEEEAPMRLVVLALPGGAGLFERLEVMIEPRPYVGVSVLIWDPEAGHWVKLYANAVRSTVARLEGRLDGETLVLRSVSPGRKRESRLSAERLGEDRWRRTQEVSEDGGKTWRVLFTDELRRSSERAEASSR